MHNTQSSDKIVLNKIQRRLTIIYWSRDWQSGFKQCKFGLSFSWPVVQMWLVANRHQQKQTSQVLGKNCTSSLQKPGKLVDTVFLLIYFQKGWWCPFQVLNMLKTFSCIDRISFTIFYQILNIAAWMRKGIEMMILWTFN